MSLPGFSLAVLQVKVVGGRKMGITQCILKKKKKNEKKNLKKKKKKNDLVIYTLNCKSMVKQPHLNTFFRYIVTMLFLKLQNPV